MGGWTSAWPTKVKDQLKRLGYSDTDINGLMKSTSLSDAAKHAKEMEKKNAGLHRAVGNQGDARFGQMALHGVAGERARPFEAHVVDRVGIRHV